MLVSTSLIFTSRKTSWRYHNRRSKNVGDRVLKAVFHFPISNPECCRIQVERLGFSD
jgi:hypothetical protein